jgi:hypothetical protein
MIFIGLSYKTSLAETVPTQSRKDQCKLPHDFKPLHRFQALTPSSTQSSTGSSELPESDKILSYK